jgi:hypothetical protein
VKEGNGKAEKEVEQKYKMERGLRSGTEVQNGKGVKVKKMQGNVQE